MTRWWLPYQLACDLRRWALQRRGFYWPRRWPERALIRACELVVYLYELPATLRANLKLRQLRAQTRRILAEADQLERELQLVQGEKLGLLLSSAGRKQEARS